MKARKKLLSKAAALMSKMRWAKRLSPEERSRSVGRQGGRRRIYVACTKYRAHNWNTIGLCYGCGLSKREARRPGHKRSLTAAAPAA